DALCSPGGAEPPAHHRARQRARRCARFVPPLSRSAFPHGIQAGRHAAAHRIQVVSEPVYSGVQVSRFWSDHVAGLVPYTPGEQPKVTDLLKLNTNENPYGPSPLALKAIKEAADARLRLYPDPESCALREAIAARHGLAFRSEEHTSE